MQLTIHQFALKMLKNINFKRSYDEKIYPQRANFLFSIAILIGKDTRMFTYILKMICTGHWCLSISSSILLICVFNTGKGRNMDSGRMHSRVLREFTNAAEVMEVSEVSGDFRKREKTLYPYFRREGRRTNPGNY